MHVWRGVQGLASLPLMLLTHQEQACPVCLHASHKGKLIIHLRKLSLCRNFPLNDSHPSSEMWRVLYSLSPLLAELLPSLLYCFPSFFPSFLPFSLLSLTTSLPLRISLHPSSYVFFF